MAVSAQAAVIIPLTANTQGHNLQGGGGISSLFDGNDNGGTSKFTKGNVNDPSTWTATGQAWQDDWQGYSNLTAGTHGKVGWVTFDLASVQSLDKIFIWNVSEGTGQNRRVVTYNVWYANSPTVAPVSGNTGNTSGTLDYNFASGGWTKLNSSALTMLAWSNGTGADGIVTLGVDARYVGLEFLTNGGATDRTGLNEVVFTTIPEPSLAILASIGFIGLLRRRK